MSDVSLKTPTQVGPVMKGDRFLQRFVAHQDGLTGISLLVGLYGKKIRCRVRMTVLAASRAHVLRVVEEDSDGFGETVWHRFSFPVINDSAGQTYWCQFEADSVATQNALTLWTDVTAPDVCLKNDRETDAAICFLTHYGCDRVTQPDNQVPIQLGAGDRLVQRFVAAKDYIESIALWIHEFPCRARPRVTLSLLDENRSEVLRTVELDFTRARENRWEEYRFEPVPQSRRRTYWIALDVADGVSQGRVSLWGDGAALDPYLLNDTHSTNAVCFRPEYGRPAKGKADLEFCCVKCSNPVEFETLGTHLRCSVCGGLFDLLDGEIPIFLSESGEQANTYGSMFSAAEAYDRQFSLHSQFGEMILMRVLALEPTVRRFSGGKILEIGAGTGTLTRALASGRFLQYERLYVTDLSGEMLAYNWKMRTAEERRLSSRYFVCNVLDLPFPDASLDLVVGLDILHHVLNYSAGLREISRALKPGGLCVLLEPTRAPTQLMAFLVRLLLRFGELPPEDVARLNDWIGCFDILVAHNKAAHHDALAHVDDKYYFDKRELRAYAESAGFDRFGEINLQTQLPPDDPGPRPRYSQICLGFFSGLGVSDHGLGVVRNVCQDLDATIGDQFLEDYPPNSLFLFWKRATGLDERFKPSAVIEI
jgi:ubiquinone/menaquinone biosynthesis C-methylase UbiE